VKLYAYGEDGMTLWALCHKLDVILSAVNDSSDPEGCLVFYRPSFGRASNQGSFGEPDFVMCSQRAVYLGESKWHFSSWAKRSDGLRGFDLRPYALRQATLKFYISEWLKQRPSSWQAFVGNLQSAPPAGHVPPKDDTRLADTLESVLTLMADHFGDQREVEVHDLLLYIYDDLTPDADWWVQPATWKRAIVCCSEVSVGRGARHDSRWRRLIELPRAASGRGEQK